MTVGRLKGSPPVAEPSNVGIIKGRCIKAAIAAYDHEIGKHIIFSRSSGLPYQQQVNIAYCEDV